MVVSVAASLKPTEKTKPNNKMVMNEKFEFRHYIDFPSNLPYPEPNFSTDFPLTKAISAPLPSSRV